jgi:hypothetical protein
MEGKVDVEDGNTISEIFKFFFFFRKIVTVSKVRDANDNEVSSIFL